MNLFIYKEPLKGSWHSETILNWKFFHLGYKPYERKHLTFISPIIFEYEAKSIVEADKQFKEKLGKMKSSISVEIIPLGYELEDLF